MDLSINEKEKKILVEAMDLYLAQEVRKRHGQVTSDQEVLKIAEEITELTNLRNKVAKAVSTKGYWEER